ncbi:hypothetical protein CQ12_27770 [Bradyrhizobium jicamae]|uniref:DUF1993 domain-containing protein n=1 Tax=Bradyrhizobium jicamae TaxID=280332 RepID=A0A0R3LKG6_9BRAD|nr:DUF1993 domain-containing protein [Bradyrhizobium jicamae]KRR07630.1 hypothetical protein CQ12_27770 [Bradyrhizobium jicamae]
MSDPVLKRTTEIFTTRLQVLAGLLDAAETQWREKAESPETLLAARLSHDMFPFPHQIVFTCNQPNQFAAWCSDAAAPEADPAKLDFAGLKRHVQDTIAYLSERTAGIDDRVLDRDKRIALPGGRFISFTGHLYVDEWLLPNFYFHLVTAYDILRHQGVRIGKANYMAHLAGRVRTAKAG